MTIHQLIACLKSNDQSARMNAAAVLAAIGDEAAPAIPTLIDLLNSDDPKDQSSPPGPWVKSAWLLRRRFLPCWKWRRKTTTGLLW